MSITNTTEQQSIRKALSNLMGENGNEFANLIIKNGKLSLYNWDTILNNVMHNSKESITRDLGLIAYYYIKFR